nr:hypothetical protein CFP56_02752 [Quercus suber]
MLAAITPSTPSAIGSDSLPCTPSIDSPYATTPRSHSTDLDALLAASHKVSGSVLHSGERGPPTPSRASREAGLPCAFPRPVSAQLSSLAHQLQSPSSPRAGHPQASQRGPIVPIVVPRRPLCTHMTMKRIHGKVVCNMCGTAPAIAWVYACTQNDELDQIMPVPIMRPLDLPPIEDTDEFFATTAQIAVTYLMHPRVVQDIGNRAYTPDQVHKLLTQKGNVFTAIRNRTKPSAETNTTARHPPNGLLAGPTDDSRRPNGDHGVPKSNSDLTEPGVPVKAAPSQKTTSSRVCSYQACPRCRPFYVDRIYMSFDTVFNGQRTALTEGEILQLPLLHPSIVKTLGLRSRPLPDLPQDKQQARPPCSFNMSITEDSDHTSDITPDSLTTSDSELDEQNSREHYPCPGGQHCPLWSPPHGCAYDNGFNDGLRAMNHGFGPEPDLTRMTPEHSSNDLYLTTGTGTGTPGSAASTPSSISLRTPKTPAIILTPIETSEDGKSFEEVLHHRLSRVGKAASVTGARLATIDEGRGDWFPPSAKAASISDVSVAGKMSDDVFGHPLRNKPSSSTLGSEVSVRGGVALTEEAVVNATPNVVDVRKAD